MAGKPPVAELDARFSSENATPTEWAEARGHLANAEVYWLSTVRPDGRPHVRPVLSVWLGGEALAYEVAPRRVFAFAKGEYGQTRWRFERRTA